MAKFRVLGRALQREDGRGKVTGEAHFTADVIRPDMLWGKILRSPLAHARIVSIDTSRARNSSGRQGGHHRSARKSEAHW